MLHIKKDMLLFINSEQEEEIINNNELLSYLGCDIKIEDDVTFQRIFDLILSNKEIFNTIYCNSHLYGHKIDDFEDEYNAPQNNENDKDIQYLEVKRIFDDFTNSDDKYSSSYYYSFHGYGKWSTKNNEAVNGDLSISLTPLNELKNIPIKFNEELKINLYDEKYEMRTMHTAYYPTSLFNFIGAILFEITFHGTPKNKKDFINKLNQSIDEIKNEETDFYELKSDENGKFYFENKNGDIEFLNGDE